MKTPSDIGAVHLPGEPRTPEPPAGLIALTDTMRDPHVVQCGITTTTDGRWALYVTVRATVSVPVASVERAAKGYPVVYDAEPEEPVRAGPAYPHDPGETGGAL